MKRAIRKFFKIAAIILAVILIAAVALFGWLTVTEYQPAPQETVEVEAAAQERTFSAHSFTLLSMNTGYCALGKDSDFFMDGGEETRPESEDIIRTNLAGIQSIIANADADFVFLQEVDTDSMRSYYVDEVAAIKESSGMTSAFALNYSCEFVPFPWPPIGKVHSGLLTLSDYTISEATRISLPCPFSWPVRTANLKRGLLVSRLSIDGSDKELVLINLHLEAYDSGEGKIAQTKQLLSLLEEEYAKGNYVIAGGDFNQVFPTSESLYPNMHPDLWSPGVLAADTIPEGWSYAYDAATPTCRLLNQPYNPADTENTQYYVIDGFIVSPNLSIDSVQTLAEDFVFSDHNPVLLSVTMK